MVRRLRISIVYKKGAGAEARSIKNKAVDAGLEVTGVYGLDEFSQREEDVVVVVGGDGSFLRVAKETDTPIALVRYMSFGFFSCCGTGDVEEFFCSLREGEVGCIELGTIEALFDGGRDLAVNEFFLDGCNNSVDFSIRSGGIELLLLSFRGDGAIISTPAGSAGHSLSYGGPLVDLSANALVLTAVAPIRNRMHSIVFGADKELEIEASRPVELLADGRRSYTVSSVMIKRSDKKVMLVRWESMNETIGRLME